MLTLKSVATPMRSSNFWAFFSPKRKKLVDSLSCLTLLLIITIRSWSMNPMNSVWCHTWIYRRLWCPLRVRPSQRVCMLMCGKVCIGPSLEKLRWACNYIEYRSWTPCWRLLLNFCGRWEALLLQYFQECDFRLPPDSIDLITYHLECRTWTFWMANPSPQECQPVLWLIFRKNAFWTGMALLSKRKCIRLCQGQSKKQPSRLCMCVSIMFWLLTLSLKLQGIADGVIYLHARGIIHGNIKCVSRLLMMHQ